MNTYEALAIFVIDNVGGSANIKSVTHCLTRLRFDLADDSLIDNDALLHSKDVVTTQSVGGKFQVVIGAQVGEVCTEIERQLGGTSQDVGGQEESRNLLDRFTSLITQVMTPVLGVLCGCGIIAGLMAILSTVGLIASTDGAYLVLNVMGNACLTFFPVILGYTSAKAFKMNPFTGMILGCILVYPGLAASMSTGNALYTIFAGTPLATPIYQTFFGIPIMFPSSGYTSTVIPIIFATFVASKVERFANRTLPQASRMFVTPMVVILVAGIVALLVVGPVSIILTNLISMGLNGLLSVVPILAYILFALVYQPLVILGFHWALISLGLIEFASSGSTLLIALIFPASFAHLAVCAAVMLRSKSKVMRETSLAAVISACFCIIEPSIYGVTLPVKKRFGICMIAGTVGAVIMGLANSKMYAIAMGVTGLASFIDPSTGSTSGLIICLISIVATMVVGFALTWITYKPADDGMSDAVDDKGIESESLPARHEKVTICAPVSGIVSPLANMGDAAFSGGALGKGACIVPAEGRIVSPCDGDLTMVFPTGHALGITTSDGAEIIIHIGTNTVQMPQGTFHVHAEKGTHVTKGELLVTFDPKAVLDQGCNLETAVLVSNSSDYLDVLLVADGNVKEGADLLVALSRDPEPSNATPHVQTAL